jgi:glycosyltransferase involved in cell wall biosynthesis
MKINIVSAVFPPEPITSARATVDLAEQLCREGHRVHVITAFPNRPAGRLYEGYKRQLWLHDRSFSGYEVLRCFSALSPKSTMTSRFLENLSFGIASGLAVLFMEKPDVIYGNTWPIFAQGMLALACRMRGIPLVLSVQDTYPESLLVQDRLGTGRAWLYKVLRWLDIKVKNSSAGLAVISEGFQQIHVQDRGIPAEKVHFIPNWIDENLVQIHPVDNCIRCSHEIPEDAFLVVYAGNVGVASGVDTVIKAFRSLTVHPNIYLLIAGSGSQVSNWRWLARDMDNPRVLFHTPWLDSETSCVLDAASIFVLPTQGDQSMVSVPSKLMTYMLAGRPVLSCVGEESDIAKVVHDAACGWVIAPRNPEAISQEILLLSQKPASELEEFGKHGRSYALQHMTRKANLPKLITLLQSFR